MRSEPAEPKTRQRLLGAVRTVIAQTSYAFAVARERRALMRLDDAELKDIGVSRADAYREGSRRLWDLPPSGGYDGSANLGPAIGEQLARKRPVEWDCSGHQPPLPLAS